jgi:hypothetical protein
MKYRREEIQGADETTVTRDKDKSKNEQQSHRLGISRVRHLWFLVSTRNASSAIMVVHVKLISPFRHAHC